MTFKAILLCCSALATSLAIGPAANAQSEGDPDAGQAKAAVCAACHGPDGNSTNGEWPKLAGQHAQYLERQLHLFKSGQRQNALMAGIIAAVSEDDFADLAAFYAAQESTPGVADESLVALGEQIYRAGDADRGLPACLACHGPSGRGNPLSGYPSLSGQHATYTASTLRAFRDGLVWGRDNMANEVMADIASRLSPSEIDAVASYLQGLH